MIYGGQTPPTNYRTLTETWDGSSWTEVADLNTARDLMGGAGASSTALSRMGRENQILLQVLKQSLGTVLHGQKLQI